ncbi:hypothetical protein AMATHDRAFT_54269 [Amanita thiersii Skay4041]|uniref:DUF300-domain-containing protein n=1 Tax=Amanita thiersii Skay4041 TaxID=703135 RepID=A0A2A9P060_9AGAR|nr:hypothetical protein AMATHDRAFT_54269 [Amanita thiersii Skay4041]
MSPTNDTSSAVCHKERAETPPSLFQNGNLVIQAHHVGWIIAGFFTLIATIASIWLINKHLRWYTDKREQRYIVRILFMVPIYALISLASFLFWNHSTPLILIRDGYESTVLTAFFYLLLMYLSHDPDEQRAIFTKYGLSREADREVLKHRDPIKKWVFPLGFVKWKPQDGLYFLQLMKWGILQYCVLRPLTTLVAVILDYAGLYCESSWGLGWGHVYITVIVSLSVTVAMYCLIQLYVTVSKLLAPQRPLLKLFAIKAVVFLTFWQATFLSLLSLFGVVKDTRYMTAEDINIGIGALLETFEMTVFAFLHIKAFSYKRYRPEEGSSSQPTPRLRSLCHAMDFRETFREIWAGCVYIFDKARGREPTSDRSAKRVKYYGDAFARQRPGQRPARITEKATSMSPTRNNKGRSGKKDAVHVKVDREVNIEGETQWLGTGGDYGYGLEFLRGERSESLEVQIEMELQKRGYGLSSSPVLPDRAPQNPDLLISRQNAHPPKRRSSWWRNIYGRLSQTEADSDQRPPSSGPTRRKSRSRARSRSRQHLRSGDDNLQLLENYPPNLDDLPPQSILGTFPRRQGSEQAIEVDRDVLMPLPVFQDIRNSRPTSPGRRSIPIDRESSPSTPAPMSSRYSGVDSLLGRLFPDSATEGDSMSMTDFGAMSDGTQSIFSLSSDAVRPAKLTPRARLTNSTPQIMVESHPIGSSRTAFKQSLAMPGIHQAAPQVPAASSAEVIFSSGPVGALKESYGPIGDHFKPSNFTPSRRLPSPPAVAAPPKLEPGAGPAMPLPKDTNNAVTHRVVSVPPNRMEVPKPQKVSQDLRRSNAEHRPRVDIPLEPQPPQELTPVRPSFPQSQSLEQPHVRQNSPPRSPNVLVKPSSNTRKAAPPPKNAVPHVHAEPSSSSRSHGRSHNRSPETPSRSSAARAEKRTPVSSSRARDSHGHHNHHHTPHHQQSSSSSQQLQNNANSHIHAHSGHHSKQSSTNRLRKHQDSRHSRMPASGTEPHNSSTRSSPTFNEGGSNDSNKTYTPRNWRTEDYQSTSWYHPANSNPQRHS